MPNQNLKTKNKFPEMWHVPVGEDLGILHAKSFSLNLDPKVAPKLDFQVAPNKFYKDVNLSSDGLFRDPLYWLVMIPTYLPWVVYDIPEAANPATGLDMLLCQQLQKVIELRRD